MKIDVSLKELGIICLALEYLIDSGECMDVEVCERLNERLVEILEKEDK